MEGFYTKQEAAKVLGVSVRQIGNYLSEEKLSRLYQGGRAWIPKEDVERLYGRKIRGPLVGQQDIVDLQDRVEHLQQQIDTLKLGLGFGSKKAPRTEVELLLLRQSAIDSLAKDSWGPRRMNEMADLLMSVQEVEVDTLVKSKGVTAWVPLCDLLYRMLVYIECHPEYPGKGLDILETRLIRARDRFLGMVYVASKTGTALPAHKAAVVYRASDLEPNTVEQHIIRFLLTAEK